MSTAHGFGGTINLEGELYEGVEIHVEQAVNVDCEEIVRSERLSVIVNQEGLSLSQLWLQFNCR